MQWNVVISLYQDGFRRARRALAPFGHAASPFHNVLVMQVEDPMNLLGEIERMTAEKPALYDAFSRVAPAERSFDFETGEAFRTQARSILAEWTPRLTGRSFHARLHQRGGSEHLPTPEAERFLDDAVLEATARAGAPARVTFEAPDAIIDIETVGQRAGMSLWTREDLATHRLLRPD